MSYTCAMTEEYHKLSGRETMMQSQMFPIVVKGLGLGLGLGLGSHMSRTCPNVPKIKFFKKKFFSKLATDLNSIYISDLVSIQKKLKLFFEAGPKLKTRKS